MNQIKQLIGKVKANCNEDWKGLEGVTLAVCKINDGNELVVLGPVSIEERELFYKHSYEGGLKDDISSDYEYCVFYLLNEDCELTCSIDADQLEDLREVTREEVEDYNKNFEEFRKLHKYYERVKQQEDEEKEEELAEEEFKKADKANVTLKTKQGDYQIQAILYKGFAIHDYPGAVPGPYKTITVIEGEFNGINMTNCSILKCKKLIDEVREYLGNRTIVETDFEKIKAIIAKY